MRSTNFAMVALVLLLAASWLGVHGSTSGQETTTDDNGFAENACADLSELPTEEQRRAFQSIHCQIIDDGEPSSVSEPDTTILGQLIQWMLFVQPVS